MENRKSFKGLLSIALVLLLVAITTLTFAFWDQLTNNKNGNIIIGEGTQIVVTETVKAPEGKKLVPAGVVLGNDDVEEVVFEYSVKLSKEAKTALNLNVTVSDVKIANEDTYANLVNIVIETSNTTVNTDEVTVTIKVTLIEPVNQTEYDAIINKPITFKVTFNAN